MLFRFCTQCGTKHEYTLHPPLYCGACGNALDLTAIAKNPVLERQTIVIPEVQQPQQVTKAPLTAREKLLLKLQRAETDDETEIDETEIDEEEKVIVPPNPGFSIEIGKQKRERIEDLARGGKPQPRQIRAAEGPLAAKNKKAFIKKFQEIAGGKSQGHTI